MITVVCGPPCAGKTTYVGEHADDEDLVLDLDVIARDLGSPVDYQHPEPYISLAQESMGGQIAALTTDMSAWVIRCDPEEAARIAGEFDGDVVHLDPGEQECLQRARFRPSGTRRAIRIWYWRERKRRTSL